MNQVAQVVIKIDDITVSGGSPFSVNLDGFDSLDPEGSVLTYFWNYGDGNTFTDVSPDHMYLTANTRTVTLTVIDSGGKAATATEMITFNQKPTAKIGHINEALSSIQRMRRCL